jgi:hypothetical protein
MLWEITRPIWTNEDGIAVGGILVRVYTVIKFCRTRSRSGIIEAWRETRDREETGMTRVTLDSETVSKLHDLQEHLELCDQSGRLLGYFVPTEDKVKYAQTEGQVSDAELNRREAEESGRPLADILRDLDAAS